MALNASKVKTQNTGSKQATLEAGNYLGRLVQVLDLGLQAQRPYQGQEKPPKHEVMLTYELGTEFVKDDDGNDDESKPRWISERIPLNSLSADLAKSTKRIKAIDPSLKHGGDLVAMLGSPCTITVVNNVNKKDPSVVYANVGNVTPPMKGIPVPELVNEPKSFDLDDPDLEIFGSLPEWIQDLIKSNLEFAGSKLDVLLSGGSADDKMVEEDVPFDADDEDSPY